MDRAKLIEKRKFLHLTQADIAEKLGIAEATYREKEKANREFTEKEIVKIIDLLGVDANYLFTK